MRNGPVKTLSLSEWRLGKQHPAGPVDGGLGGWFGHSALMGQLLMGVLMRRCLGCWTVAQQLVTDRRRARPGIDRQPGQPLLGERDDLLRGVVR